MGMISEIHEEFERKTRRTAYIAGIFWPITLIPYLILEAIDYF